MEQSAARAVEALIEDYGRLVFHTLRALTNSWEESQDLAQEVYLQAFRGIDAARAASGADFHPKAWLMKITVNAARMSWRKRTVRGIPFSALQPKDEGEAGSGEADAHREELRGADDPATLVAERDLVQLCLHALPDAFRLPLILSIVAGFSSREIATMLGLREATVRQRLVRAREAFRARYTQESGEELHGGRAASARKQISRSRGHLAHRSPVLAPAQ